MGRTLRTRSPRFERGTFHCTNTNPRNNYNAGPTTLYGIPTQAILCWIHLDLHPLAHSASSGFRELQKFLKSTSFSRAILVGIGVTLPILAGLYLGHFEIGLAISFGAYWSSPSDISGSFRRKKIGILISATLVMVVSFIGGHLHYETWLSLPILGILGFGIAYFSIYGFRASLVSFSGLLAMVLSLGHEAEQLEIYQYALLAGVGGLWYLLLAKIQHHMDPKAETEEMLSETFQLTAEFVEIRGKLIGSHQDREILQSENLRLQSELTRVHGTLREILILSRRTSGLSNYQDKRLLIFVQLVDMLETAIAHPVNYDRMDPLFRRHPRFIGLFQELIFKIAEHLRLLSESDTSRSTMPGLDAIEHCVDQVRREVALLDEPSELEANIMLRNMLLYQEKQFIKLKRIKRLLVDQEVPKIGPTERKAAKRFIAPLDHDPALLWTNFSFKSNIFRHSLRLSVVVMIGYALGSLFPFQNPYWILLTIVVIMRPSYGLTKSRAKDRMIGTLIGGAIATGMIFLIQGPYIYGALGMISLVFSVSLVQRNSKASAIFITVSVVSIYAIIRPDILNVISFRILDTLVGAGLSYAAMIWLWPVWESVEIRDSIIKSVRANKEFLHEIASYYQRKGNVPTSYDLARKEAFLETSNLNAAFQRMAQEPKSKQHEMSKNYELVVLNHNFLASLASLSTFIRHHETSAASDQFNNAIGSVENNLELLLGCSKNDQCSSTQAIADNNFHFEVQLPVLDFQEINRPDPNDNRHLWALQESHLVWEHLQWLFSISGKMLKLTSGNSNGLSDKYTPTNT